MLDFNATYHWISHYEDNELYQFFINQAARHVPLSNFMALDFKPGLDEWLILEEQYMDYACAFDLPEISIHLPMNQGVDEALYAYLSEAGYQLAITELVSLASKPTPSGKNQPKNLDLKEITADSLPAFLAFQAHYDKDYGLAYQEEMQGYYREAFLKDNIHQLAVFDQGQVIAVMQVITSRYYIEIDHLTVREDWQKQEIGRWLVQWAYKQGQEAEKTLILVCDADSPARQFYDHLGFVGQGFELAFSRPIDQDFKEQFYYQD
ncbi:N-acetyltransferase [Aerococcus loyolae]|uniref:GNAT family N-acetyltransferase n=2 Tax=Bacillati TaxID=1783272 RepID=UPI0008A2ACEF|nr:MULTISPECIES: GNAT family N-acetyltransferase [Aerococcus]MCY3067665.1 GNAT family N-acetyltransferase [Aerococcus mictus]MCY3080434.1 GNAT family N-acetyltransferase [Aerococcus mictus]MDK7910087.1 GNAT family N-acetyltransferase [Aerococcus urinae]MDK8610208.1 GNAT family N-acetyltransferase [Aerococcus urinae]MDL5182873.1 GNAT family N-acetyltransferase [Aerococcus loyolae]